MHQCCKKLAMIRRRHLRKSMKLFTQMLSMRFYRCSSRRVVSLEVQEKNLVRMKRAKPWMILRWANWWITKNFRVMTHPVIYFKTYLHRTLMKRMLIVKQKSLSNKNSQKFRRHLLENSLVANLKILQLLACPDPLHLMSKRIHYCPKLPSLPP